MHLVECRRAKPVDINGPTATTRLYIVPKSGPLNLNAAIKYLKRTLANLENTIARVETLLEEQLALKASAESRKSGSDESAKPSDNQSPDA